MAKQKESSSNKKEKMGRPKGSKSKLGIPPKGIIEAVALVKSAYEKAGNNIMSVQDITDFMNLKKGSNYPMLGMLASDYGLIEKEGDIGYRISDLGERAIKGEKFAIKESFEKNSLFRDLSTQFWDKNVTPGLIIDYLKKKYKKGDNVNLIAQRFLEGSNYIKSIGGSQYSSELNSPKNSEPSPIDEDIILLLKLKYLFIPPSENIKESTLKSILEKFRNSNDVGIKSL